MSNDLGQALSVSALSFAYVKEQKRQSIISDLNLDVRQGELISILGASGCGKTTLLNLIAGLLEPQAGTIKIAGGHKHNAVGYIFQEDALLPWRTVGHNLRLAAELHHHLKASNETNLQDYLKSFHLSADIVKKYPGELSGGMRQRVSIIQSLLFRPELILLDEPFSALDFYTKLRLESEFYTLIKKQNKAAILVTHDIDEAIAISDRVLIMDREGKFSGEFIVDLKEREPEDVRGTPEFATYFHQIWSALKSNIAYEAS